MPNTTKTDCILFRPDMKDPKNGCKGLNYLYCSLGETCRFYKPRSRYDDDGTEKAGDARC